MKFLILFIILISFVNLNCEKLQSGKLQLFSNVRRCPNPGRLCRATKDEKDRHGEYGKLLHNPRKSDGKRLWTSTCGVNYMKPGTDPRCRDIGKCEKAGAFGIWFRALTGDCQKKSFIHLFGLDGFTWGIMHSIATYLPQYFQYLHQDERTRDKFKRWFIDTNLVDYDVERYQEKDQFCTSPQWVCDSNRDNELYCGDGLRFQKTFRYSLYDPDFQKVQLGMVWDKFAKRVNSALRFDLKTEFGIVMMATVKNNLPNRAECKPSHWKTKCMEEGFTEEKIHGVTLETLDKVGEDAPESELVECMLNWYAKGGCRGSQKGAIRRRRSILKAFEGLDKTKKFEIISITDIEECTNQWGVPTPRSDEGRGSLPEGVVDGSEIEDFNNNPEEEEGEGEHGLSELLNIEHWLEAFFESIPSSEDTIKTLRTLHQWLGEQIDQLEQRI